MAKVYVGVNNTAKEVKKIFVGVNGAAKEVKKIFVGVNGAAKLCYKAYKQLTKALSNNTQGLYEIDGSNIWHKGDQTFYSKGTIHYKFTSDYPNKWVKVTWNGLTDFDGKNIWTDGTNVYYSYGSKQYVLNSSTWTAKTWNGLTSFNRENVWTDGTKIYYSAGNASGSSAVQYELNTSTSTWTSMTWAGPSELYGKCIWTDGTNIYYSNWGANYVLNAAKNNWLSKTWNGLTRFTGETVWRDESVNNGKTYVLNSSTQYELDTSTSTWTTKTWSNNGPLDGRYVWKHKQGSITYIYFSKDGCNIRIDGGIMTNVDWTGNSFFTASKLWYNINNDYLYYCNGSDNYMYYRIALGHDTAWSLTDSPINGIKFSGINVWTDGTNIYYSNYSNQYVLNGNTWETKNWNGTNPSGNYLFDKGPDIYYMPYREYNFYKLDKSTDTWISINWSGLSRYSANVIYVWSDGTNTYHSNGTDHYVLNKTSNVWESKTFYGLTNFSGSNVWFDGTTAYYSDGTNHYVYNKKTSTWTAKTWTNNSDFSGDNVWTDGENMYYSGLNAQYKFE